MARTIQHKRGLEKNLPTLKPGEIAVTTDTKKVFVGTDNGNIEVTNKAAVDSLTSQLADTSNKMRNNLTMSSEKKIPAITLLDDDGRPEVWSVLRDISITRNVPFCSAVITGRLNKPAEHISVSQMKELENMGWEIMGHTYTHPTGGPGGLLNYAGDYTKLEYEIGSGCKDVLTGLGFNVTGFVYPQGGTDFDIREITKKHYDYAFAKVGFNDDSLQDTTQLMRIAFGLSANLNPSVNGNNEKSTLAYYKACVDYAVANNVWLTFMIHVNSHTPEQNQMLYDLVDYIKSLNVKVLTARDAYKIHGNRFFAGDVEKGKYFIVDKNNEPRIGSKMSGGSSYNQMLFTDFTPTLSVDTPVTAFPEKSKTAVYLTHTNATNNGFPTGGVLYVERQASDLYSTREIWEYQKHIVYRSYWNGSAWTPFKKLYDDKYYDVTTNAITASTLPNDMSAAQKERPFMTKVQSSQATGLPDNYPGLLYTDVTKGSTWNYQLYFRSNSNRIYKRNFNGTAWMDWSYVGGESKAENLKELAIDVGAISPNSAKTFPVTSTIFLLGDSLIANPKFSLPLGLSYNAYITANGTVTLNVINSTTSAITCPNDTWMFRAIKNF